MLRKSRCIVLFAITLLAIPGTLLRTPTLVRASSGPLAAFTYEPCFTCLVIGNLIFFNGNWSESPNDPIVSYTWNFGDGSPPATSSSPGVAHDYGNNGGNVTLTVTDSSGLSDSITQLALFSSVPRFDYEPKTPAIYHPVIFNATLSKVYYSTNTTSAFSWAFGDGPTGSGAITSHAYSSINVFRTLLTFHTANGNPQVSETLRTSPNVAKILIQTTFDGYNINATGWFAADTTSKSIIGSATVQVANATTGSLVIVKTYNVSFSYRLRSIIRAVLAIPTSPHALGVTCTVNPTNDSASCLVSRNPDLNNDGIVDFIDVAIVFYNYGRTPGSVGYNPPADLNADGIGDIVDAGLAAGDYGAPVFQ